MKYSKQRPRDICAEWSPSDFKPYHRYLQRADTYAAASSSAVDCANRSELLISSSGRSKHTRSPRLHLATPAVRSDVIHVYSSSSQDLDELQHDGLQTSEGIEVQDRSYTRRTCTNDESQARATVKIFDPEYSGVPTNRSGSPIKARTRYFSTYALGQARALSDFNELHQPVDSLDDILLMAMYQNVPEEPCSSRLPGLDSPIDSRKSPLVRRTLRKRPRDCVVPICQNYRIQFLPPQSKKDQSLIKRSPRCSI